MKTILLFCLFFAVTFITGCDTFFAIDAVVTDAATGLPISDATATLVLDKGFEEPNTIETTGTNGELEMIVNEPDTAWMTLTVEKQGYETWSTQFRGKPRPGFVIPLKPAVDN